MRSPRLVSAVCAVAACALTLAGVALLGGGGGESRPAQGEGPFAQGGLESARPAPRPVEPEVGAPVIAEAEPEVGLQTPETPHGVPRDPEAHLARPPSSGPGSEVSPGAPTDAQVRAELREIEGSGSGRARVLANGEAVAPGGAPLLVKQVIAAGNAIARSPYLWGGGHARLYDRGYDCSGSLSFAFIHAGLLERPIAQGWSTMGAPGPGRWISVYSNPGHVFMVVAGLRFDTSAIHIAGSRWTDQPRSTAGFTVRHIPGL